MRVLVTGGAGFIGRHVVDMLREHGHSPVVFDRIEGFELIDAQAVAREVEEVDAVCHQAAKVGLGVDLDDVVDYVRDTDLGTAMLLRALHRTGFDRRLVLASSMVVYGEGRYRCAQDGLVRPGPRAPHALAAGRFEPPCPTCGAPLAPEAVPESAPLDPRNVYAATKVHQEHLVSSWARESGGHAVMLRYHNVYGPGMPRETPYAGVSAIFQAALLRGEPPRVFEDGAQRRDFVHVHDVARANLLALTDPSAEGAFNICSGQPQTLLAMARAMSAGTGIEPVVTGEWRLGDVRHVFADPAQGRLGLGFEATVEFEEGIRSLASAPGTPSAGSARATA